MPNIRSTRRREDCLLIRPSAQRWDQLDPGARAVSVIYPLHTGELGGPLLMTVRGVDGLALFGLSVTGVWQWWRRRMPSGTRSR
ncbi:PepSY domain-containing protein [Paraburkholderia terrae]|uniref:PepSY domain-containing protein n=1 Tax=Paraburkholderia terrae TaxID=311230 RepID=UPI00296AAC0F|nr:PepSY domain-containing protein [Paraburkholderia terrae]